MLVMVMMTQSKPLDLSVNKDGGERAFAADYLHRYGYLTKSSGSQTSSLQSIDKAVWEFQAFAGIRQTGKLNEETMEMMKRRRCGVKDIQEDGKFQNKTEVITVLRKKRFALQGSRWKTRSLTYRVTKYPSKKGLKK